MKQPPRVVLEPFGALFPGQPRQDVADLVLRDAEFLVQGLGRLPALLEDPDDLRLTVKPSAEIWLLAEVCGADQDRLLREVDRQANRGMLAAAAFSL